MGFGVYDIYLFCVLNEGEIDNIIEVIFVKVLSKKVWINFDCGLKICGILEIKESLICFVEAVKAVCEKL